MSDKPLQDDEIFLRLAQETETATGASRAPVTIQRDARGMLYISNTD